MFTYKQYFSFIRHYRPIYTTMPHLPEFYLTTAAPYSPFCVEGKHPSGIKQHGHRYSIVPWSYAKNSFIVTFVTPFHMPEVLRDPDVHSSLIHASQTNFWQTLLGQKIMGFKAQRFVCVLPVGISFLLCFLCTCDLINYKQTAAPASMKNASAQIFYSLSSSKISLIYSKFMPILYLKCYLKLEF